MEAVEIRNNDIKKVEKDILENRSQPLRKYLNDNVVPFFD